MTPDKPGRAGSLDEEVQARVFTEKIAIKLGYPETSPNYRNADGTVNEAFITRQINGSSHYNPTDKTRVGRRYVGECTVPIP